MGVRGVLMVFRMALQGFLLHLEGGFGRISMLWKAWALGAFARISDTNLTPKSQTTASSSA